MEPANVKSLLTMMLILITPRLSPSAAVDIYSNSPSYHRSEVLGEKVTVISTETGAGASLPRKDGRAEMLNSSLVNYSQLTVCARFLTLHFSTDPDGWPTQSLISYGSDDLLGSYLAMSCDQSYTGCTEEYRDIFSASQLSWISGSVFGYFSLSNTPQFYPAWWPAVWNTACLTASPGLGTFRIIINGLTVWQTKEFNGNLFNREKVTHIIQIKYLPKYLIN